VNNALTDLKQGRTLSDATVLGLAADAYAYRDEIARNEAERRKPQPVITQCLLIVFALAVFAVNLAVFGKGAW